MQALEKLVRECSAIFDVVPIFDQTLGRFPIDRISPDALAVVCAEMQADLDYPKKHQQHPGTLWPNNIDLPLMWFRQRYPNYEYYWVIEYDVRFSGYWPDFFDNFAENSSDLLAITVFDYQFRPSWRFWDTFDAPVDIPREQRLRATLSFYRLSSRALAAVHLAYSEGVSGHYEVAIPTVLKHAGMRIEDIGGNGDYVAPGNRNRFYTNSPKTPGLAPGTFVLLEEERVKADIPNMLWNPFKD